MQVALPHALGKEEVRRRMHARSHEIAGYFPPGMATIETSWPSDDQMDMMITAAGQKINGVIEIYESEVMIRLELPAILSFLRGTLERSVRKEATKLLK